MHIRPDYIGFNDHTRRLLGGGGFASRYKSHYGGAGSPEPEEVRGVCVLID